MFYITSGVSNDVPPSHIDLSKAVAERAPARPFAMDYWPSYADMTAHQRATYLDWLAGGRKDPSIPIGYVFVFFYGLERRLLENENVAEIRAELHRLHEIYGENSSFRSYTTRLLVFSAAKRIDMLSEHELNEAFPLHDHLQALSREALRARLTWYARKRRGLPWHVALAAAVHDERAPSSVVLTRVREEFESLFAERYEERFGHGFVVDHLGRRSNMEYRPACHGLRQELFARGDNSAFTVSLDDPQNRASQFKPLLALFSECIDDLRSYSRSIGQSFDEELTVEAWEKLPVDLQKKTPHPHHRQWVRIVEENVDSDGWAHVAASTISELCGIAAKRNFSRDECRSIAEMADAMGFIIEPDPRILPQSWRGEDKLVLMKAPAADVAADASGSYQSAAIVHYLAMYIATADSEVDERESELLEGSILEMFYLNDWERKRLAAATAALSSSELDMRGASDLLETNLRKSERKTLADLLVRVALADGVLDKNEEAYLKRAYSALGLDPAVGIDRARELASKTNQSIAEPVQVHEASQRDTNVPIPRPAAGDAGPEVFQLDRARLAHTMRETRAVAEKLGEVFSDDLTDDIDTDDKPVETPSRSSIDEASNNDLNSGPYSALSERYRTFMSALVENTEWSTEELAALSREHGLMMHGAVSAINDWSDEHLGDFLIEGNGPFRVYASLLSEKDNV